MTAPAALRSLADQMGMGFVQELLEDFHADAPWRMEELDTAIRLGDCTRAGRAAHTLGSMVLTLGFDELGRVCRELEAALARAECAHLSPDAARAAALLDQALATTGRLRAGA